LFKTMQKRKSHAILAELTSLKSWNMYKIKAFSQVLSENAFTKGQGNAYRCRIL
jgi:hypothetical protein